MQTRYRTHAIRYRWNWSTVNWCASVTGCTTSACSHAQKDTELQVPISSGARGMGKVVSSGAESSGLAIRSKVSFTLSSLFKFFCLSTIAVCSMTQIK